MPELIVPHRRVRGSFLQAMSEFAAEGRGGSDDSSTIGRDLRDRQWATPDGFGDYVASVIADAQESSPRREGYVPQTTLWWVEADDYLGRIGIRHRMTQFLFDVGGHIGYDVRPTCRRLGHATAMLRAALPVAHGLGIEWALITCDTANTASAKVIEANGGVLEDVRGVKRRYWVRTDCEPLEAYRGR